MNTSTEFGNVISSYTREQALDDGFLVDVTEIATEAGIRYPVALTTSVYEMIVPPKRSRTDLQGRLWDTVWMLRVAMKSAPEGEDQITMTVKLGNRRRWFKVVVTGGDNCEPVITVSQLDES